GRSTRLKFDDFLSDLIPINNGIGQGAPESMILYVIYNADFLELSKDKFNLAGGFVDDV
ncbi:hypothetical protein BDN72DRAFT_741244, partial [Pluteus cervinus]